MLSLFSTEMRTGTKVKQNPKLAACGSGAEMSPPAP